MSDSKVKGGVNRRTFLKAGVATGITAAVGDRLFGEPMLNFLGKTDVVHAADGGKQFSACCPSLGLCAATCPLKVTVKDGRITHITNHPDYLCCTKGHSQRSFVYDPSRLKYPMKRVGERGEGKFQRIPGTRRLTSMPERSKRSAASMATSPSCSIRRAAPWALPAWRRRSDSRTFLAGWRRFGVRCALPTRPRSLL